MRLGRSQQDSHTPELAPLPGAVENARVSEPVYAGPPEPRVRPMGLWILLVIVAVGMGIPAFTIWQKELAAQNRDRIHAEAPTTSEGRVQLYMTLAAPGVYEALTKSRFSSAQPWIVTHVVAPAAEGEPPSVYGVDVSELPRSCVYQDGLEVVIQMPEPTLLTRDVLVGDNALGVPVYTPDQSPDGPALLEARLRFALKRMMESLPEDIEGASYAFRFTGWPVPSAGPQGPSEGV